MIEVRLELTALALSPLSQALQVLSQVLRFDSNNLCKQTKWKVNKPSFSRETCNFCYIKRHRNSCLMCLVVGNYVVLHCALHGKFDTQVNKQLVATIPREMYVLATKRLIFKN